jgi:hypothetical protein
MERNQMELWHIMAYHGISWRIMAYFSICWHIIMGCYGMLWRNKLWHIMNILTPVNAVQDAILTATFLSPWHKGKKKHPGGRKKIFFIVVYMIWCVYNDCHNLQHLSSNKKRGTGQEIGIRSESPRPIPGFRFAGAPSFWPIDIRFIVSRKNQGFPENIYTSSYPIQTKVIYNVLKKCVPSFCMEHLRGPNDVIVQ